MDRETKLSKREWDVPLSDTWDVHLSDTWDVHLSYTCSIEISLDQSPWKDPQLEQQELHERPLNTSHEFSHGAIT